MEKKVETSEQEHNFKSRKDWLQALQHGPNSSLLKERSLGSGKKSTYLPLHYQQALCEVFFDEFDVIENRVDIVFNEIVCTVKCQGLPSYPNSEYRTFAGIASKPIQCNAGSNVALFPKGKKANALEYNAPASRSAAISNALSTLGNIFGRNLGRDVKDDYKMNQKPDKKKKSKKKNKK